MKKNRILKFALIGIVIVALGFMGLNLIQAQVKTLVKPVKEPSYTWSLRVLENSPNITPNIIGMTDLYPSDHIYKDGVLNTTIYYEKHYIRELKGTQTAFLIFIDSTPSDQEWVTFQNVDYISDFTYYPEDGEPQLDLYTFLDDQHPLPTYDTMWFSLAFFEDLENFETGDVVQFKELALIKILFWNERDWEDKPVNDAHTLFASAGNNLDGFIITRTGTDTWEFSISQQLFELDEQYYCEVQGEPIGRSGKYKTVTKLLHPQTAKTKLSFVFELTREEI